MSSCYEGMPNLPIVCAEPHIAARFACFAVLRKSAFEFKKRHLFCCSQQAYNEQEDILRPYSSLSYAWDEPSLSHRLVISQPGNRKLGVFNLDKVAIVHGVVQYLARGLELANEFSERRQICFQARCMITFRGTAMHLQVLKLYMRHDGRWSLQVGEVSYVWPNRSVKRQDKDMRLQILVKAEGPTRVLFIIDLLVRP